jgi:hypothetical protein
MNEMLDRSIVKEPETVSTTEETCSKSIRDHSSEDTSFVIEIDTTVKQSSLPEGIKVQFISRSYNLDTLTQTLTELEQEHDMSSVEMFRQYLNGTLDPELEYWAERFILFLGTPQVRRLVHP